MRKKNQEEEQRLLKREIDRCNAFAKQNPVWVPPFRITPLGEKQDWSEFQENRTYTMFLSDGMRAAGVSTEEIDRLAQEGKC